MVSSLHKPGYDAQQTGNVSRPSHSQKTSGPPLSRLSGQSGLTLPDQVILPFTVAAISTYIVMALEHHYF